MPILAGLFFSSLQASFSPSGKGLDSGESSSEFAARSTGLQMLAELSNTLDKFLNPFFTKYGARSGKPFFRDVRRLNKSPFWTSEIFYSSTSRPMREPTSRGREDERSCDLRSVCRRTQLSTAPPPEEAKSAAGRISHFAPSLFASYFFHFASGCR